MCLGTKKTPIKCWRFFGECRPPPSPNNTLPDWLSWWVDFQAFSPNFHIIGTNSQVLCMSCTLAKVCDLSVLLVLGVLFLLSKKLNFANLFFIFWLSCCSFRLKLFLCIVIIVSVATLLLFLCLLVWWIYICSLEQWAATFDISQHLKTKMLMICVSSVVNRNVQETWDMIYALHDWRSSGYSMPNSWLLPGKSVSTHQANFQLFQVFQGALFFWLLFLSWILLLLQWN